MTGVRIDTEEVTSSILVSPTTKTGPEQAEPATHRGGYCALHDWSPLMAIGATARHHQDGAVSRKRIDAGPDQAQTHPELIDHFAFDDVVSHGRVIVSPNSRVYSRAGYSRFSSKYWRCARTSPCSASDSSLTARY